MTASWETILEIFYWLMEWIQNYDEYDLIGLRDKYPIVLLNDPLYSKEYSQWNQGMTIWSLWAWVISRILHKTSGCFIFQAFKIQLVPIFLFKSQTKLKFFTRILLKRKSHDLAQWNFKYVLYICWMMRRPTYR